MYGFFEHASFAWTKHDATKMKVCLRELVDRKLAMPGKSAKRVFISCMNKKR
jgi:hypothetical protein